MADGAITFKIDNKKPIELLDLTASLAAFAESFQDYVVSSGSDLDRDNVKLLIRELKSGSVIADLIADPTQASITWENAKVAAGFLVHLNEVIQYLLGVKTSSVTEPKRRDVENVSQVMEPIAKDPGAQIFLQTNNGNPSVVQNVYNFNFQEANIVQNNARRFLGPKMPTSEVRDDVLLRLHQVRGDASSKVGDRGIIEEITKSPVKVSFASEAAKQSMLDQPYPFQCIYVVHAEIKSSEGKPALYRILAVKDVIQRP